MRLVEWSCIRFLELFLNGNECCRSIEIKRNMKKLFVSAGLVAIGAAALESAMADDTGPKYWTVGATLRGFYDDNYNIQAPNKGSWGVELMPTVSAHVPLRQTDIGIRYTYGLYYYQDRNDADVNPFDQTHEVDLWIDHRFNERWEGKVTDTFSAGQEPELLNPNPALSQAVPYRINGNNIANHGNLELDTIWTRLLSTAFHYSDDFYDYQNKGAVEDLAEPSGVRTGSFNGPSLAGTLNSVNHYVGLDLKWLLDPETTLLVGYEFDWYDYIGNEPIAYDNLVGRYYNSSDRNTMVHKVYVGVDEQFLPNLQAKIEAGGEYDDAYADPINPSTTWNPYASISASYTYLPGCFVQLGFNQDIGTTDVTAPDSAGHITQYSKTSVVYLSVNHRITQKLVASVIGRLEYDSYEGGAAASDDTTDYGLGVDLSYQIDQHFSVDAGYNYDNVQSDVPGIEYSRNRVYLGLTATY